MVIVGLPGEDYPGCSSSCLKPVVSEHRCLSMWCPRDTHVQHSSVHHRKIHRIFSKEYTLGKKLDIAQIEGFMNGGWKFCISSSDFSNNEAQLRVCQDWGSNSGPCACKASGGTTEWKNLCTMPGSAISTHSYTVVGRTSVHFLNSDYPRNCFCLLDSSQPGDRLLRPFLFQVFYPGSFPPGQAPRAPTANFPNFLPWLYISSITRKKNIFSQVMDSPLLRHKSCNLQLPDKDCCSRRMCFTRLQIVTVSNPGTSAAPLTGSKDLLLTDDPLTISP
ncbi:uncharacterized protein LOC101718151 isoform X1 [Heterocephalus glaber]|uniref:Uncharacterized protein LOC101718151 isoform X1 n=1 Tax=Heterocephalus glaber TaxID=10181 RepID=A0AAX6R9F2_HETGA|nr:uncharacterized protein LOC101718151 isoform X1 [Heterocephalus glaber]